MKRNRPSTAVATVELAKRINTHHAAIVHALANALNDAMAAGDLLMQVKKQLRHGEWQPWLAEHFEGSDRTARAYMQLAANRAEIEKTVPGTVLSVTEARKLIAGPPRPKPTELPDLSTGEVWAAGGMIGEHFALLQFERADDDPPAWRYQIWNVGGDSRAVRTRPVDLDTERIEVIEAACGFTRRTPWAAYKREEAPAPVLTAEEIEREAADALSAA